MAHKLLSRQNDDEHVLLLKASSAAYRNSKRGEIFITMFILFLSYAYPFTYIYLKDETAKMVLFGCSFLLNIAIQILTGVLKDNTSKGALFKEEFDVSLFSLKRKTTLKIPGRDDISKYAEKFRGSPPVNWYSVYLNEQIPDNIAIAAFQHTNTSWDINLRRKYKRYLITYMLAYSAGLACLLYFSCADFQTSFFTMFSVFMFYSHFITLVRGHASAISRRESVSSFLDRIIFKDRKADLQQLRDIQDEIYFTRQESAKVPDFFFKMNRKKMNQEAEEFINRVNRLYSGSGDPQ